MRFVRQGRKGKRERGRQAGRQAELYKAITESLTLVFLSYLADKTQKLILEKIIV